MSEVLEVDFKKIPEWLQERRKLEEDWNRKLKALRLKQQELVEQTLKTLKDKNIVDYINEKKQNFTYLDCLNLIQKLDLSQEGQEKGFFGGQSSQIIKDWKNVDKIYKKGNLHIVELARIMVQSVQYDIPGMRKQLVNIEQQINSTSQKVTEYKLLIKQAKLDFQKQCQVYGIEGNNIQREVPAMISQLPEIFKEISKLVKNNKDLNECLQYYLKYSKYACESTNPQMQILQKFMLVGDVPALNFESNEEKIHTQYDWYLSQRLEGSVVAQQEESIEDWELIQQPIIQNQEAVEIDWTKYMEVDKQSEQSKQLPVFVDTILSNNSCRNQLITDLNEVIFFSQKELLYFLKSRISSTKLYSQNALLQVYDSEESQDLFDQTIESYQLWHDLVEIILVKLNCQQLRQLLTMKDNNKSQNRILDHLQQFQQTEQRAFVNINNCQAKVIDLEKDKQTNQDQLSEITKQTIQAKAQAQIFLKELIKWQVNITGEVNKIK